MTASLIVRGTHASDICRLRPASPYASSFNELCEHYQDWAIGYYVHPTGKPTTQVSIIGPCCRRLCEHMGGLDPLDFTTPLLNRYIGHLAETSGLARATINRDRATILHMLKWAAGEGLVPASVFTEARAAGSLKRGRTVARDPEPVKPVTWWDFQRTLERVSSRQVQGILLTMWWTGARVGEVLPMRVGEIEVRPDAWIYRPKHHKTAHHEKSRFVVLGPAAQVAMASFVVGRTPESYVFDSTQSVREHALCRAVHRKTAPQQGNSAGTNRERPIEIEPRPFTTGAIQKAIKVACRLAGVKPWHPHQLRHAAATRLCSEEGLDAARLLLGHADPRTTARYAQPDVSRAVSLAMKHA